MSFLDFYKVYTLRSKKGAHYLELNAAQILGTIKKLELRIENRFPQSGLLQVCKEFEDEASRARKLSLQLSEPIWPVRLAIIAAALVLLYIGFSVVAALVQRFSLDTQDFSEILQASEAALNELIFFSLALYFLINLEKRLKQHVALKALHRLRSVAHVVDMHQLTKDPADLLAKNQLAVEPKKPQLSSYELTRYLDYCSELLALISKVSALFAQYMDDPVVLTAVNDLQSLTQGLSGKIWQKIMILDLAVE
ncbi:MAG: hypothetical protein IPL65_02490 [Lewinellaceae bacterium]|nr:hypothetical protein [Lewinellaceae bacterium]